MSDTLDITKELADARKVLVPAMARIKRTLERLKPEDVPAGRLADTLYDLRSLIKLVPQLAEPFTEVIAPKVKEVEEHFIRTLAAGESSGVQGAMARVQVTPNVIPVVEDWPKFYAYIKRTGEFELMNKTVSREAVRERWENKKKVPGVGTFTAKTVSCTKLPKRKAVKK